MKVIHLISGGDAGGAKTYLLYLLPRLNEDVNIKLVTLNRGCLYEEAKACGIDVESMADGMRDTVRRIAKLSREWGADLLHCHGARANVTGMLVKRKVDIPVITTVHSDYHVDYTGLPLKWLTFGMANRFALRRLDYYIGVSEDIAHQLIRRGFAPHKVFHVYNGIDFDIQVPRLSEDTRRPYLEGLGLSYQSGDIVCGIAARLTDSKDIPTLLRGFHLAAGQEPRLKLVIAGDGEDREALLALRSELGLNDRVAFPGWIGGMDSFFGALDINLLTSKGGEGLSYSVLEGVRAGCATISSADGGLLALIDHEENGFLFPVGDHTALGRCILRLAQNDSLRDDFVRRLRQKGLEQFSVPVMAEAYLNIYQRVLTRFANPKRPGVTLCGAYGMDNSGDEAILEVILEEIRRLDPDLPVTVLSRQKMETRLSRRVDAIHMFNFPALWKTLKHSRLLVCGGGTVIQNATSNRSLTYYLHVIRQAKRLGCRVAMVGSGIGPVSGARRAKRTGCILNDCADVIALRDDLSKTALDALQVTRPRVIMSADPALALRPASGDKLDALFRREGFAPGQRFFALSVREWSGFERLAREFATVCDYVYDTYGLTPAFLPIESHDEASFARIAPHLRCPYIAVRSTCTSQDFIGLLSRAELVLAMRLHAVIFAAGVGVPAVAVSYDPKVRGFMEYACQDTVCDIEDWNTTVICGWIDNAMRDGGLRDRLRGEAGRLRDLETRNGEVLRDEITGGTV